MHADESREKSIGGGRPLIIGLLSRELAYATRPTFLFVPRPASKDSRSDGH